MTSTVALNFSPGTPPQRKLSVSEYHRMMDAGILKSGEPYELIRGALVLKDRAARGEDRMTIGRDHLWAVNNLARIGRNLDQFGCFMQTQGPVVMSDFDEPEPDGAIVAGTEDDYRADKPCAKDVTCVIEVADSSLADDRGSKLETYANSGIAQYIIVNLADKAVEIHTQPEAGRDRYGHVETLHGGAVVRVALPNGQVLQLPAEKLLP